MSPHRIASRPSCTRKSDAPILLPSVRRSSAATHGPIHAPAPLAFTPLPHVFIPCPLSLACQTALLGVWLYIQHTVLTSRPTPCGGNRPNDHRLPRRAGAVVRRRGCGRARRRRGGLGDPTDSSAAIRARTDHRIPDCGDPMAAEMVYGARRGPGRRRGGTGVARRRVAAASASLSRLLPPLRRLRQFRKNCSAYGPCQTTAVERATSTCPRLRVHPLNGELQGHYAATVSGNWWVTFRFEDGDAVDVNYLDYH